MATVTMTIEEYEALMALVRQESGTLGNTNMFGSTDMPELSENMRQDKPKKRKRSKYNRELSRQLKMLKKKHPRTAVTALMKRAHRATKKALK